jgi:hypothetical protein
MSVEGLINVGLDADGPLPLLVRALPNRGIATSDGQGPMH